MASSTSPPRVKRSDAKRNVSALLEAAKTVFVSDGVDAPAKQITDLAGVGVGTLYRHFPRRSDLIVAVLQHEIDACVDAADELRAALPPWDALTAWIERFADFVVTKRGLAAALHSGDPAYDGLTELLLDRIEPALGALLDGVGARREGRDDLTSREILTAVSLLCHPIPGARPAFNQTAARVFVQGLAQPRD